jgi:excisionase family DNA binding protein
VIRVDREGLLREILAAVGELPELAVELRRVLGVEAGGCATVSLATYAAEHELGVSTVRRYAAEGRLPVIRVGRLVRVARDAVIAPMSTDDALERAEQKLGLVRGGRR